MILVVDDFPSSRRVIALALKTAGYEVMSAASSAEAVALLNKHDFQLVITDLVMPGLNGSYLAKAIRLKWPKIPVILMSGHVPADAGKGILNEAAAFLQKPIEPTDLVSAVERVLPMRPARETQKRTLP